MSSSDSSTVDYSRLVGTTVVERDASWDWLRGVAVLGVIGIHARLLAGVGVEMPAGLIILALGALSVPVFFAVSGVLAVHTLERPWHVFLRAQRRRLVWPYVIWASIGALASVYVRHEATWSLRYVAMFIVRPSAVTTAWFLIYLAAFMVLAKLLRWIRPGWMAGGALVAVILAWIVLGSIPAIVQNGCCFVLGLELERLGVVSKVRSSLCLSRASLLALWFSLVVMVVVAAIHRGELRRDGLEYFILLGAVMLSVLASRQAYDLDRSLFLERVGRHSLEIYVVHWPVMLVVAAFLGELGAYASPAVGFLLLAGVSLVVAGLLIGAATKFTIVGALFAEPRWNRSRLRR